MLYTAMFDEINEGTAIFKLAADPSQRPVGTDLVPLGADGCRTATSDMYLRLAGQARASRAALGARVGSYRHVRPVQIPP